MADYVIRVKDQIDKGVISKLGQIESFSKDAAHSMSNLVNKSVLMADVSRALSSRLTPVAKSLSGIGRSATAARSNVEALTVASGGLSRVASQASSSLNKMQTEALEAGVAVSLLRVEAEKLSKVLLPMARMGDVFKGAKNTANNLKTIMGAQAQASKQSQVTTSRINALHTAIERLGAKSSDATPKVTNLANALLAAGVAAEMYGKETRQLGPVLRDLLKNNGLLVTAKNRLSKQTSQLAKDLNKYSSANSRAAMEQAKVAREMQRVQQGAARTTSALAKANSQIEALKNKSYGAMGGVRRLAQNLMAFFAIGFSGSQIIEIADSYTILQNKLSNVSKDQANLNKITEETFATATRARVPVDDVAKSFSRFDLAIRGLGKSQKDVMGITETITKSLVLGGATTQEASAGLLQLSQAFNKGKLDGDEFRSMMELMPAAADAIAKQLKVTRGELLDLAPKGKITAEVMVKAFEAMKKDVEEKFKKMVPTISQSLVVLGNSFRLAWGKMTSSTGALSGLADVIMKIGLNMDKILPIITLVGTAIATYFGVTAVTALASATTAMLAFNTAVGLNPLGVLAATLVGITAAMVLFGEQTQWGTDKLVTLRDVGTATVKVLVEKITGFGGTWGDVWQGAVINTQAAFKAIWETFKTVTTWFVDHIVGFVRWASDPFINLANKIITVFRSIPTAIGYVMTATVNLIIDGINGATEAMDNFLQNKVKTSRVWRTVLGENVANTPKIEHVTGLFTGESQESMEAHLAKLWNTLDKDIAKRKSDSENLSQLWRDGLYLADESIRALSIDVYAQAQEDARKRIEVSKTDSTYYEQARPVIPGSSSAEKAGKAAQKAQKLIDRNTAGDGSDPLRKKYVDALKSMIGMRTAAEACADTVRDAAKKVGLEFGVTQRAIDDATYGRREAGSFFGTDVSEIKTRSQVKPGDLVAIKKTYGNFGDDITHVATISKILEDGQLQIIDNAGRIIQERLLTAYEKANIVGYATPKALLKYTKRGGPTPEEAQQKDKRKDDETYAKIVGKNAVEIANEIVQLKLLSVEREKQEMFDKVEEQLYAKKLNWRGKDAELTRKQIDLLVEARKMQSAYDSIYQNSNSSQLNELDLQLRANKKAFDDGKISIQDYNREKYNLNEAILNLMDPLREMNQQMREEDYLLSISADKREAEAILLDKIKKLKREGSFIDPITIENLRKETQSRIENNRAMERQAQLLENATANKVANTNKISDIESLLKGGKDYTQGDAARDVTDILGGMGLSTENFATALQGERDLFAQHLDELELMKQKGLISDAEYYSAKVQFQLKSQEQSLNFASEFFGNLSALSQSNNETLFRVGKAAAIAGALVDTYRGAAKAIAEFPGPMGIALAAATVVSGLANVAQIRSQQMTGYKAGGYTGNMPTNQVAGVVHGREFVMNAAATQRIGVGNLQALQNGSSLQGNQTIQGAPQTAPAKEAPAPIVNVPVQVAAVISPEDVRETFRGREGDTIILEALQRNKTSVSKILR